MLNWYKITIFIGIILFAVLFPLFLSKWLDKNDKDTEDCECENKCG
jgi:hypothetical protein